MLESRSARARVEGGGQTLGRHVEVMGVGVVEARGHVVPEVAQRGRQLLLGRHHHEAVGGYQVQELTEAVDRQQLGDVGPLALLADRRDLGQLTVLGAQLGGRLDCHPLDLLQRPLGEGGEEREAFDLDVEHLAAHRALLGGGVHVEDVSPDRELTAVLHLFGVLVPAGHQLSGGLVEVEQAALLDLESVRAQRGVGHLLGESNCAGHDDRGSLFGVGWREQRVERGDPQPHQVRRGGQVRLVAHASGGVEAHRPGAQELLEIRGEVTRSAVVARHHQRRPARLGVQQRGEQVGPQAGGHESALSASPVRPRRGPRQRGRNGRR